MGWDRNELRLRVYGYMLYIDPGVKFLLSGENHHSIVILLIFIIGFPPFVRMMVREYNIEPRLSLKLIGMNWTIYYKYLHL